jgi:ABC-type branched-subunit amino acid transport system ATPase component
MIAADALLKVQGVTRRFSGLVAVDDVSFEVAPGEIHALIGPNGAGKTTMLNLLTRIYPADAGTILFEGSSMARTPRHEVVRLGIARTFQHVELFPRLTALDNVALGAVAQGRLGIVESLLALPRAGASRRRADAFAASLLDEVGLGHLALREARSLTGGQARLVGLARALAARPRLLLLDELVAGLNNDETEHAAAIVRGLRDRRDITILAVEHDMRFVMGVSDRITVLNFGRCIASGSKDEVQSDPQVIEAYLGSGHHKLRRGETASAHPTTGGANAEG